jgi:hypothetical protein
MILSKTGYSIFQYFLWRISRYFWSLLYGYFFQAVLQYMKTFNRAAGV